MTTLPTPGSIYVDDTGRTLHVTRVDVSDRLERHVCGEINGRAYACSLQTWQVIRSAREVREEVHVADSGLAPSMDGLAPLPDVEPVPAPDKLTALYAPDGSQLPRKPGWG